MKSKISATTNQRDDASRLQSIRDQACLRTMPSMTLATSSQASVAASRKSMISFHLMMATGSRSSSKSLRARAAGCGRPRSRAGGSRAGVGDAGVPLERLHRDDDLRGRGRGSGRARAPPGGPARSGRAHERRRVSIGSMTSSSVRASAWMSSRSIGVTNVRWSRWMISWVSKSHVLDLLDLVRLVPDRMIGCQHLLELAGADADLLRHRDKVVKEPLFTRNESKGHRFLPWPQVSGPQGS